MIKEGGASPPEVGVRGPGSVSGDVYTGKGTKTAAQWKLVPDLCSRASSVDDLWSAAQILLAFLTFLLPVASPRPGQARWVRVEKLHFHAGWGL